jgi:hypothetical protein
MFQVPTGLPPHGLTAGQLKPDAMIDWPPSADGPGAEPSGAFLPPDDPPQAEKTSIERAVNLRMVLPSPFFTVVGLLVDIDCQKTIPPYYQIFWLMSMGY